MAACDAGAASPPPMDFTNTSFGGHNCSFVEVDPGQELYCLICARVLREPQLTDCCGNHYCSSCLQKWRETSPACPLCRERDFSTLRDKKTERIINALKVKCNNHKSGCVWTGDLGDLEAHIKRDCLHVLTECSNGCGHILQRREVSDHLEHQCYLRQVQCEHCGMEGAYQSVVDEHYDQCPKVPVACPNACGGDPTPREELDAHRTVCPLELVQCKFHVVGCKVMSARKYLPDHLGKCQAEHLEMALSVVVTMQQKMESHHSEVLLLKEELDRSKDAQESLNKMFTSCSLVSREGVGLSCTPMLQHLEADASDSLASPFLPVVIKMENFSEWAAKREPWYSAPFYTGTFGYKMTLCVYANGTCSGQGTHLSVYVHLMPGEFDERLEWPVREAITVELQNQLSDSCHCRLDCSFSQSSPRVVTRRVSGSVARRGSGSPVFISLSKLGLQQGGTSQRPQRCQFLKNNCLYFSAY